MMPTNPTENDPTENDVTVTSPKRGTYQKETYPEFLYVRERLYTPDGREREFDAWGKFDDFEDGSVVAVYVLKHVKRVKVEVRRTLE